MQIHFTKSRWEYASVPLETYFDRVATDGFDGAEIFLAAENAKPERIRAGLRERKLFLIAHVAGLGRTVEEHLANLEKQITHAKECEAVLINTHSGSDFFPFDDNVRIFQRALDISKTCGIPICHETHRGQPLFNLPDTLRYLDALPDLRITADFSHYMCVHESELQDQEELLDLVIARTRHIHARVGFTEGPQVAHPLTPERAELLNRYLGWWKKIIAAIGQSGANRACITPEAGPPPYMPVIPFSECPVADAWTVNVQMKNWLKENLSA
jgi:sugar phosphate isomerase/epimerase